jgi:hypothetical protein
MFELVHIVAQHHLAPLLFCKKEQDKSITRRNRASNPNPKTRRHPRQQVLLLLFCLLLKSFSLKLLDLSVSN